MIKKQGLNNLQMEAFQRLYNEANDEQKLKLFAYCSTHLNDDSYNHNKDLILST